MGDLVPMLRSSEIFTDARGEERTMRVTHHPEAGIVVVSLWVGPVCRASFRLPTDELPRLRAVLAFADGVAGAEAPTSPGPSGGPPDVTSADESVA